ncbi:MAG: N-acetyltransferase, partial [Pyrinomonadaceae bacterium]
LKGGAVDNPVVRRLYQKIAMCLPDGESYVSGRAFRRLSKLSSKSLREIIKNLPESAWNYEP